jgi:hypothetical protein
MLTDELLIDIFGYLDYEDLVKCASVSRKWNQVAEDYRLWKSLYHRTWTGIKLGKRKRSDFGQEINDVRLSWKSKFKSQINWINGKYSLKKLRLSEDNVVASMCHNYMFYIESGNVKVCDMSGNLCSSLRSSWKDIDPSSTGKVVISAFAYESPYHDYLICIGGDNFIRLLTYSSQTKKLDILISLYKTREPVVFFTYSHQILACRLHTSIEVLYLHSANLTSLHSLSTRASPLPTHIAISGSCFGPQLVCVTLAFHQTLISRESCVCLQELHFNTKTQKLHMSRQARSLFAASPTVDKFPVISYKPSHLMLGSSDNLLTHFHVKSTKQSLIIEPGQTLWGHSSGITHIDILPAGKAVSVSRNGMEIQRWNLQIARLDSTLPVRINPEDYSQAVSCLSSSDHQLCLEVLKDCLQSFIVYDFTS